VNLYLVYITYIEVVNRIVVLYNTDRKEYTMADVFFCSVTENKLLTEAIYSITVKSNEIASESKPGQFLHIKCGHSRILRRPISICDVNGDSITFIFEVKGEGTNWLSKRMPGQKLDIMGPLGNGFEIPDDKIIIIGGGVGTPPMLYAAKAAKQKATAILGFREKSRVILTDEFEAACDELYITTDDGSVGIHGAVTKPLETLLKTGKYKAVMSCGQLLMQKAVADMCAKYGISSQVSLEERMGCGVGACLVCACETKGTDGNSKMSRACLEGPVFNANDVIW